jgi:hypothetical protein
MESRSPNHNVWKLDRNTGKLHSGPLSAHVDVSRPDLGLQQLRLNDRDLPGRLLAVERHTETQAQESAWPLPLADAYIRGHDLVATYQSTNDWPYSPQLYWSADPLQSVDPLLGSLSLLISVQTHLLDTWPQISVSSRLACRELLQVNAGTGAWELLQAERTIRPAATACCLLYRLPDAPVSLVEIMPAGDFRELAIRPTAHGECRAEWRLFADFLEKGVIRRATLQTAFVPRENDIQIALKCCAATERRPLPLTT